MASNCTLKVHQRCLSIHTVPLGANQKANSYASSARSWSVSSVQDSSTSAPPRRWGQLYRRPWVAVLVRVLIGGVFIFSGFSKLLLPHAEVVALVQQYQVL